MTSDSPPTATATLPIRPDVLATHIASLFQATFTEIGLFVVVFLAVAESQKADWWWGTNVAVALYIVLLGAAAVQLLRLHSLTPRTDDQAARLYRWAWRTFCWANAVILVYLLVVWYFHTLYVYAWS